MKAENRKTEPENQPRRVNIIQHGKADNKKQDSDPAGQGAAKPAPDLKPVDNNANAALLALLKVEAEARDAQSQAELVFLIANEMRKLTRARQVFVLRQRSGSGFVVEGINSQDSVDRNSPMIRWVERMVRQLKKQDGVDGPRQFSLPAYCGMSEEETRTYPFKEFVWLPFQLKDDSVYGGVLLAREQQWREADIVIAKRLANTFSHAWAAITGVRRLRSKGRTRMVLVAGALSCIAIAMAIPVPISALAPSEIVSAKPYVVTAPIDGVIDQIFVNPNATVRTGQPILKFVDISLRNKLAVARRETIVAQAQLRRYSQSAFDDPEAKRELRTAMSQLELKRAEAKFARELLAKTVVNAATSGVLVFNDKKEWIGRPVVVGQRIMEIADPGQVRLKVELPVNDAIVVGDHARVKVFLDSDPLHALKATVVSAAHEARKTSTDVLAYEIIAKFDKTTGKPPRLGVRGTAQIYGEKAPVFFYLFRRPLSALRQKLGL